MISSASFLTWAFFSWSVRLGPFGVSEEQPVKANAMEAKTQKNNNRGVIMSASVLFREERGRCGLPLESQ